MRLGQILEPADVKLERSVVHQHVQPPEFGHRAPDGCKAEITLGHIAGDGDRAPALRLHLAADGIGILLLVRQMHDGDVRAFPCEQQRHRAPDA